jgi:DNA replication protein DnaC
MNEPLEQKLATLRLGRIRQIYASWIEQAATSNLGYGEFLDQLLTEELLARQENHLRRKMKAAGFPYPATIEQFDFSARPELKRPVILRFFDSSFVTTACSLLLIGPSGLGKTHLSIALGTKMVQLGYSVRFVVAQQLANALLETTSRREITQLLEPLIACDVLILDEFGYLPIDPHVGPALYEIIAGRYQKGATIITSNKSLATWGELIGDNALMMAIIDLLLHHGEVFYVRGSSYRMRGKELVTLTAKPESGAVTSNGTV